MLDKRGVVNPTGWEQGDCFVGAEDFVYRLDPKNRTASKSSEFYHVGEAKNNQYLVTSEVIGFMIVTQTCDIINPKHDTIEIAPLRKIGDNNFNLVKKKIYFNYAFIPNLEQKRLVADLSRIMTIEKPVLLKWEKTPGFSKDWDKAYQEKKDLAQVLGNKRSRLPFHDDFVDFTKKLRNEIIDRKKGKFFDVFREIRVRASPSWQNNNEITLIFLLIQEEKTEEFDRTDYNSYFKTLVPKVGRFKKIHSKVLHLRDLSALEYVNSDLLQFILS